MRDANAEHLDAPGIKSPGKPCSTDFFCIKETIKKYEMQNKTTSSCIIHLGTTASLAKQPHTGSWHCGRSSTEREDGAIRRLPLRPGKHRPQSAKSSLWDNKLKRRGKGGITAGWFGTARGTRCCTVTFPFPKQQCASAPVHGHRPAGWSRPGAGDCCATSSNGATWDIITACSSARPLPQGAE